MRISFDKPDEGTSSCIIKAYHNIKSTCKFPVEYKFVVFCVDNDTHEMKMQSLPSLNYHILPDDELCLKCKTAGRANEKLLKDWNNALRKESVEFLQTKELEITELATIAKEITSLRQLEINQVHKVFPVYDSPKGAVLDATLLTKIFIAWKEKNQTVKEPRRIFARKLLELGPHLDLEKIKTLANEIDPYY
ncbi:PREDICTED: uncharacterized protein LOC109583234 [Amphimedon queenslandica]|uniref:Uncharacterized protein n=2 Tax=Amphimedon queenslandica TaxID=400682 RepID=A0AAN0JBB6_AMPQE|nr:PREDICTED: uncharacterized protein LOC109583234 [Amphimedon queenslandica]|eukprot:XP_019854041.1 PREDICTED: uncharacterized protein LOC109583234 [Amphimedon queenslandica]